jgi:nucleoside-diphosphate-sugar epimerase
MRVVITGGAGFLGSRLARSILERGQLTDASGARREVKRLVLIDVAQSSLHDPRVETITGDLADLALIERALTPDTDSVFHLAAVVSGQAEAEFDTGMHVNLDATRGLLERCRKLARPPKFVFTSSLAVFGGALPDPVRDDSPITPQTSYGAQKAIGELMVYDMTRKGYIDGRSLRLPTVRCGPASRTRPHRRSRVASFASRCPVSRRSVPWRARQGCGDLAARAVIANIIKGHEAPASASRTRARSTYRGFSFRSSDGCGAA